MIIWMAMLIPLIGCVLAYLSWSHKFLWWELLIPTVLSFLVILITKFTVENAKLQDTQYRGGIVVEARYYEYWSTWVHKQCEERYKCGSHYEGTGKDRRSVDDYCTRWVDCSYCDEHPARWEVLDNQGHTWSISKDEYNRLTKKWNATPQFVDMKRSIDKHWGCGKDGDMYSIKWGGDILNVETSTWTTTYENKVQASKSHFDLKEVSKEEAKKFHLYEYPTLDSYTQHNILGLEKLKYLNPSHQLGATQMFDYFNGYYGPIRKIRVYVLLFFGQPFDVGVKQRYYWDGGNKNEMVICIDVDSTTGRINWVYPFTWSENKRVSIDLREDINNLVKLDFTRLYHVVEASTTEFKYRDFKQFDYMEIEPDTWEIWFVYIITLLITCGTLYYGYQNEFVAP